MSTPSRESWENLRKEWMNAVILTDGMNEVEANNAMADWWLDRIEKLLLSKDAVLAEKIEGLRWHNPWEGKLLDANSAAAENQRNSAHYNRGIDAVLKLINKGI